ncbi:LuxR family transcriptional regulator, partial [Streptomyces actuosus]|nr:LuxR family transcriptional regulator [Streptomyces actuosus]
MVELTTFVGRRREVAQAKELLAQNRLVTLTGAGGIGKTRLANRVAADLRRAFPGGVWTVEFGPLTDGTLVPQTVVDALGLAEQSSRQPLDILRDFVAARPVLLVLDNCEHLIEDCGTLVTELLRAAPELKVLATSRQTLRVPGEALLPVPPLSLPDADGGPQTVVRSDAVRLFLRRAALVRAGLEPTAEQTDAIAEICRRLDGIPLAIELAAARIRELSAQEILQRIEDRLGLLVTGTRAVPPRHRTLRAAVDWSYRMCSEQEQSLWARLSVFRGGFDLEAVEEVCTGDGIEPSDVLDLITALVDKSVLVSEDGAPRMRYRLLETLLVYGRERLAADGRDEALRRRHLDWYRRLAEQGEWDWRDSRQLNWLARMGTERGNNRAALQYCLDTPGQARTALGMAGALWPFWLSVGGFTEARGWLSQALALEGEDSPERAKALWISGLFAVLQGEQNESLRRLAEGREVAARLDD